MSRIVTASRGFGYFVASGVQRITQLQQREG